ncbi:MAG: hypothetical protein ACOCWI_00055 [Bacillota bacterium]
MTKKTKKAFIFSIIGVIMAGVVVAMVFLGIFLYRRYTPNVRFAYAQQTWDEAIRKTAYDDIAIDLSLGQDENTLDTLLTIEGERIYEGENISANYQINFISVYEGMSIDILSLEAEIETSQEENTFRVTQKEGLMDFNGFETSFSEKQVEDIDLSLDRIILYNTDKLSIDKSGSYYIEGRSAINDVVDALSLALTDYIEIDLWDLLDTKTNFSRVRGDVYYEGAFFANKIKSSQNISFYMPWQELDVIVEDMSEDIPQAILEIYENKEIEVDVPIVGKQSIDLLDYMPDGLLANVRIITETRYQILD